MKCKHCSPACAGHDCRDCGKCPRCDGSRQPAENQGGSGYEAHGHHERQECPDCGWKS